MIANLVIYVVVKDTFWCSGSVGSPCYVSDPPCVKKKQMTCAEMTNFTCRGVAWMG
jgi:hypothetical protein